jgi:prepilin-type N-terminal cleavage/methylation domain-containing protein
MRGFSLLEVIIVVGIFSVLATLGLFMSMETFRGTLYRSEEALIVSLLQKARSRSMANVAQSPWSVCYIAPNYVIAKGSACTSIAAYEVIEANAKVSADSDFAHTFPVVVFTQLSGNATAAAVTVTQDARSSTISINSVGTIIW